MTGSVSECGRQKVDELMRRLYILSRGTMHQTLLANYSIADCYRNHLDPTYIVSQRPIVRAARLSWKLLSEVFNAHMAIRIGAALWTFIGLPSLLVRCLHLGVNSYAWQGDVNAKIVLLRTGVANEPAIARWAEQKEGEPVAMLQYYEDSPLRVANLRHLPGVLKTYFAISKSTVHGIQLLSRTNEIDKDELNALIPAWFVLFARHIGSISCNFHWAKVYLTSRVTNGLYFTMNLGNENAFRLALPGIPVAYVEHGFPRRDIPPLLCQQYVYSEGYAKYLRSFEPELNVDVIGLAYFESEEIKPTRTIIVASLQDWPQIKVQEVQTEFNEGLAAARQAGWKLVFRTRSYDTDAFANSLEGPWDEISQASEETFRECMIRTQPAMVWTTWSTAVLDASASEVTPVAFASPNLNKYFIADLESIALVLGAEDGTKSTLQEALQMTDVDSAKRVVRLGFQALKDAKPIAASH